MQHSKTDKPPRSSCLLLDTCLINWEVCSSPMVNILTSLMRTVMLSFFPVIWCHRIHQPMPPVSSSESCSAYCCLSAFASLAYPHCLSAYLCCSTTHSTDTVVGDGISSGLGVVSVVLVQHQAKRRHPQPTTGAQPTTIALVLQVVETEAAGLHICPQGAHSHLTNKEPTSILCHSSLSPAPCSNQDFLRINMMMTTLLELTPE